MKGKIKIVLFLVTILFVAVVPCYAYPGADLRFDTRTATSTSYSELLTDIRNLMRDPDINYGNTGLPVLKKPTKTPRYVLVEIELSDEKSITFALRYENLYLDAYLDIFKGNYRSHAFKDAPDFAKESLFPEAKGQANRLIMDYKSTYEGIMSAAAIKDKNKFKLGVEPLQDYIDKVYGYKTTKKTEAQLMLVSLQMLSEAARFRYIENVISHNLLTGYFPDFKMIDFETSWKKISKGIKKSVKGVFVPPLILKDVHDQQWKVTQVKEIVDDMGILLYIDDKEKTLLFQFYEQILRFFNGNNGDDDDHVEEL